MEKVKHEIGDMVNAWYEFGVLTIPNNFVDRTDLNSDEKLVFARISGSTEDGEENEDDTCNWTRKEIAESLGLNIEIVHKAITRLIDLKLMEIE